MLRWLELEARLADPAEGATTAAVPVPGAGLFDREGEPDPHAVRLRERVVDRHGEAFLRRERARAEAAVESLPRRSPPLEALDLRRDRLPLAAARPLAAERLEHALAWRDALAALDESRPLRDRWLRSPLAATGRRLSESERVRVEALAQQLEDSALRLLQSARPDRGRALAVTLGRVQALRRSLDRGRLLTLDPRAGAPAGALRRVDPAASESRERALAAWHGALRGSHHQLRERLASGAPWSESTLHVVELLAARDAALERGLRESEPIEIGVGRWLPLPTGERTISRLAGSSGSGTAAREDLERYGEALDELHAYGLIGRNCATELVRAWRGAFDSEADAARALGGDLRPSQAGSFVPFALHRAVKTRLRWSEESVLPGYRRRRIEEMKRVENDLGVFLREGNTLTSTLYQAQPSEGYFLVYTDGAPWLRPVLGVLNLGYGLLQTSAGLLTAPFDAAQRLGRGLRGSFYSLPELAFFNIRKGHYEWNDELDRATRGAPPGLSPTAPPAHTPSHDDTHARHRAGGRSGPPKEDARARP